MTRVAAFDCGTNSLRLLIADVDAASGRQRELLRELRIVRLGEGVDRSGRISPAAVSRMIEALDEYVGRLERYSVERVRFCGTSALRDAANAEEVTHAISARLGVTPEVLSGEAEARLTFEGATRTLRAALPAPYLVVDIGGGSTEVILGEREVSRQQSMDIGSVRLTERFLAQDPPSRDQIRRLTEYVEEVLDSCTVPLSSAGAVIAVAGTATTVAAGALRLSGYDRDLVHHSVIDVASVQGTVHQLLGMSVAERRALPYMHPGRADVIGAGGVILDRVLRRAQVYSMLVSEQDILDGIAWSLTRQDAHHDTQHDQQTAHDDPGAGTPGDPAQEPR